MPDEQVSHPVAAIAVLCALTLTSLNNALGDGIQPTENHTVLLAGLAMGYTVAHYVAADQWTNVLTWMCINAKMHALSFWRWVGWYCPQHLQPWYCRDVWTNQTSVVYAEPSNAWWTAVVWATLTAMYVAACEDYKDAFFFRAFDATFWFMFVVAPHLPRLYVEGAAGFLIVGVVAVAVVFGVKRTQCWAPEQWAWLVLSVVVFAGRLGSGGHIHHVEWPWWLVPLTIRIPQGGAVAGLLMGISAQEFTGVGIL